MESVKEFTDRYIREHREKDIAWLKRTYHLSQTEAEFRASVMAGDALEAAIASGTIDTRRK